MALLKQLAEKDDLTEQAEPAQPQMTSFFRRVEPAEQQRAVQQQMADGKEELRQKRIAEEEEEAARPKRINVLLRAPTPTTNPMARVRLLELVQALRGSTEPLFSFSDFLLSIFCFSP